MDALGRPFVVQGTPETRVPHVLYMSSYIACLYDEPRTTILSSHCQSLEMKHTNSPIVDHLLHPIFSPLPVCDKPRSDERRFGSML